MITLLIDTSSEYCLLALIKDDATLIHTFYLHHNRLSQRLVPDIIALLHSANLSIETIDQIAVGVGPGSYTGTRVGVAVAKTLAFGRHLPLKGFCSLLAFLPDKEGSFACVMPAKSGAYFLLKGHQSSHSILVQHSGLHTRENLSQELHTVDFVSVNQPETLEGFASSQTIVPFNHCPHNLYKLLHTEPLHQAELIYLHSPS